MARATPEVTIEERSQTLIVGTARDYTMQTRGEIPAQWQDFFQSDYPIEAAEAAAYGVSFSVTPDGAFKYGIGRAVAGEEVAIPNGCCKMELSEGRYAVLRHFSPMAELPGHFDWLFSQWLPASGHRQREGAVFERYPEDNRNSPTEMYYEIWLPIHS